MRLRQFLALLLAALLFLTAPVCHAIDRADYDMPYYIVVDINNQIVTVYDSATDGVVRQMLCSSGRNITPIGTFTMPRKKKASERQPWYYIDMYRRYVRYASRIYDLILFHSIPFPTSASRCNPSTPGRRRSWGSPPPTAAYACAGRTRRSYRKTACPGRW